MHVAENVFIFYSPPVEINVTLSRGYSGIFIGQGWILTHGSILAPILLESPWLYDYIEALSPGQLTFIPTIEKSIDNTTLSIYRKRRTIESGKLTAIWKCPILKDTLEDSLGSWTFNNQESPDHLLLPILVLVKCDHAHESPQNYQLKNKEENGEKTEDRGRIEEALLRLSKRATVARPFKGSRIEIVSTPFGNALFVDSVARGIIGNLVGIEKCLILMDVTAFPGREGAPVYLIDNRGRKNICGMVIASLSWCRGEWVDYAFAVNLLPSLRRILRRGLLPPDGSRGFLISTILPFFPGRQQSTYEIEWLEGSVVMVKCGPNWGTGILVDEQTGTFLTCAHVLSKAFEHEIELRKSRGGNLHWRANAKLIYKTPEGKPYDIAVLRIDSKPRDLSMKAIKMADELPRKGERVLSIGFPFSATSEATVSSGVISNVSNCMLQTSCCAQSGASGGPIVRPNNREMLGMIVCNAVSSNSSTIYPRLSMAIPVTVLKGSLDDYIRTSDPRTLDKLTESNANVEGIWNLRPFLFSRM